MLVQVMMKILSVAVTRVTVIDLAVLRTMTTMIRTMSVMETMMMDRRAAATRHRAVGKVTEVCVVPVLAG